MLSRDLERRVADLERRARQRPAAYTQLAGSSRGLRDVLFSTSTDIAVNTWVSVDIDAGKSLVGWDLVALVGSRGSDGYEPMVSMTDGDLLRAATRTSPLSAYWAIPFEVAYADEDTLDFHTSLAEEDDLTLEYIIGYRL